MLLGCGGGLDEAAVEVALWVVVGHNNFGQLLSLQRDPRKFGADPAETAAEDPLGLFIVVVLVAAQAAAAEQREQQQQQEGDQ